MEKKPSVLRVLFEKHREVIMYLIFGVVTTAVSWVVYSLCEVALRGNTAVYTFTLTALKEIETEVFSVDLKLSIVLANTISWIIAVLVAFVTNKLWVFGSKSWKPGLVAREVSAFIGGRVLTGILEILAVPLLEGAGLNQTLFGVEGLPAKIIVSVVIIILNYIISKFVAFKNSGEPERQ